jgi:hypothetical protein
MKPYHWTIFGLLLDIIGAFLVSVEAIKLDNLRAFRTKILSPIHTVTLSPKIKFVEDGMVSSASSRFMLFYNGLHYLAGFLLLVGVNYILNGRLLNWSWSIINWLSGKSWYVIALVGLLILIFLVFGIVAGLWMLGELLHMAITQLTRLPLVALDFIDARTPNGTIGIIGFVLLFLGFLLQMWSAYLSGIRS